MSCAAIASFCDTGIPKPKTNMRRCKKGDVVEFNCKRYTVLKKFTSNSCSTVLEVKDMSFPFKVYVLKETRNTLFGGKVDHPENQVTLPLKLGALSNCGRVFDVHGFDSTPKSVRILMEYFPLGDVFDYFEHKTIVDEKVLVPYAREMLECLVTCHDSGVAHLDVKPENFMVRSRDPLRLSLIDFEFSRMVEDPFKVESLSRPNGTTWYCAPEVKKGKYHLRSDVWSFGATCMVLLTCDTPLNFQSSNLMGVDIDGIRGTYRFLSENFIDFLVCCLNKDPLKRYSANSLLRHPWISNNFET